MKKVLGIMCVLLLLGATVEARETGPPAETSATEISICFDNVAIGVQFDHRPVADSDIDIFGMTFNTALFMGDETDTGLLKGPHTLALIMVRSGTPSITIINSAEASASKLEATSATGVDLLGAGKMDTAIFMGESTTPRRGNVAFIHSPAANANIGSCGLICEI
ncbi:MAG: hypothetical protein HY980_03640 [Candidatus Magasanikbacteria bacterium]|nr:hypothetical protein [Candidatus Magasanikbacteria bacterium]